MSFEQLKFEPTQAEQFLIHHYSKSVTEVEALSGGNWSQAFAFKINGLSRVIRFSKPGEDYVTDKFATRFNAGSLPIPTVLEIGEITEGYFAISERAFGTMVDNLDKQMMVQIIPSLMRNLDALREAAISDTIGYGMWDASGNGKFSSW